MSKQKTEDKKPVIATNKAQPIVDKSGAKPASLQAVDKSASQSNVLLWLGLIILFAGVVGYYLIPPVYPKYYRVAALAVGLVLGLVFALMSQAGKDSVELGKGAMQELRKIVWPSRQETVRLTIVVFFFSAAVSLYLFVSDKLIEWLLYDWLLGR